jgi:aminopeptidase N
MGDSVFQKFIRTFYDRFKGKNADTNDLEKIAEEVSNKDWNYFFKQWLYTPGIPQLDIQWKKDEKDKTVSITVTQVQSQFVFQFPLQIKFVDEQGSEIKTLNITKQSETFSIPVTAITRAIVADPNTLLLFDSRIEKINP